MPDDITKRQPQDGKRINVHEDYEVQFWCKHFNVDKQTLINAVNAVGTYADKVAEYFAKR